jgi:hypothetical protein
MKKRLSNQGEQAVFEEIVGTISKYRAQVYRKVRVADVVDIDELSDRRLGTYALKSHFDFCVCDERHYPLFAIEFDGRGHDRRRDDDKNKIATEADLPLFRIDERLLSCTQGHMTFLQYIVHIWFCGVEFFRMQEAGEIPFDEPFIMSSFLKNDAKNIFDSEFNFRGFAVGRLIKTMNRLKLKVDPLFQHLKITTIVYGRDDSSFVAFSSTSVENKEVFGRARIDIGTPYLGRLEELPFGWSALSDFCEGLCIDDLSDNVDLVFTNGAHIALNLHQILDESASLKTAGYRQLRASSDGSSALWAAFGK